MKLLSEFAKQIKTLGELRYVWFSSFNCNIEFVESYLLPTALQMDLPKNRVDYEHFQAALTEKNIDFRVFCDKRFMEVGQNKRTALPVHGISPAGFEGFPRKGLFHPKVVYLEDVAGRRILGAGSANLTLDGWGRNQEVFQFFEIQTREQYLAAKGYWSELFANVGEECPLLDRRNFLHFISNWSFVHSFQSDTFLKQLFKGIESEWLMVWSPYLPFDLARHIQRVKSEVGVDALKIALVPERIDDRYIPTRWNEALQELVNAGDISFHENPTPRHDNVERCHAKVWKLPGRLAIGSWNFTGPGANCLVDANDEWSEENNIEAGFLIDDHNTWQEGVGKAIRPTRADFASVEQINEEALHIPDELPFDIRVKFDWARQRYECAGDWRNGTIDNSFTLKLPGEKNPLALKWLARKKALEFKPIFVDDPVELLKEHRFQIMQHGKEIFHGLITETGLKFRRAQAYESLSDLFDALVVDGEPTVGGPVGFRLPMRESSELFDDELLMESEQHVQLQQTHTNYFRLFQAMEHYSCRIEAAKTSADLTQLVFSRPGCLREIVDKVMEAERSAEPGVYRWFLAQEVNTLCKLALKMRSKLGTPDEAIPLERWKALSVTVPALPEGVHPEYITLVRRECHYADA